MADTCLWRLSAAQLREGYARRAFSPLEVAREIFARIERLDPLLNAFLARNLDGAMTAAAAAEKAWLSTAEKPLLCGIPVSIKDTIEMKGLPTTYGSAAFRNNRQDDAEVVFRLRAAGAVILGKTNTPEFALGTAVVNKLAEPGRNPWNLACTCGGSSGGAAAAVAAGLGPVAIGTDSSGSIRLPAAYVGVFGLKPSFQRIPEVQAWRASPMRGHIGVITRKVEDAAMVMAAIAGPDERDPNSILAEPDYGSFQMGSLVGLRVAVSPTLGQADLLPPAEAADAVATARSILDTLGCVTLDADPPIIPRPEEMDTGVWAYAGDHYNAAEALVPGFWQRHQAELTDYARPIFAAGSIARAWQYRRVLLRNDEYRQRMRSWFRSYNFLLCPAAGPAPYLSPEHHPHNEAGKSDDVRFLATFNHAHTPAAVIPLYLSKGGLPVAVQIVGHEGDDPGVLRLAAYLEAATRFVDAWPSLATSAWVRSNYERPPTAAQREV